MNAYFFNLTKEERQNILDKHKHVYDGYVTQYAKPNEQPLYVQDFANDKGGITINNRGEVGHYRNVGINEDIMSGAKFEPEVNIESYDEMDEQLDMIGDGPDDLPNGVIDVDSLDFDDDFEDLEDNDIMMFSLGEEEDTETLKESVNKTLDMFRRFKNY